MPHFNTINNRDGCPTNALLDLSRMPSETIFERISLIDLLSCAFYNLSKIREPDLPVLLRNYGEYVIIINDLLFG